MNAERSFGSESHRRYIDNPRLITVKAWRPPVPKGHRVFIEPKPRDRAA